MQKLIQFDDKESDLMYNTELFPLKRQVNQKIYTLFEQIKSGLKDTAQHKQFIFPTGTDSETGKISQGENYLSYPWVILDFPKLFNKHEIFAFRTLFWYGHYFSFSLVLAGTVAEFYIANIIRNRNLLKGRSLYFSIHEDAWQHVISEENCLLLDNMSDQMIQNHLKDRSYLKISGKISSFDAKEIYSKVEELYIIFLNTLSGSTDTNH